MNFIRIIDSNNNIRVIDLYFFEKDKVELLLEFPFYLIENFDKIKGNPNFTVIGHIVDAQEGNHLITRANTKIELKARGWNALSE
jgi:hypothetical protein